jgi:hypothetical protein
MVYPKADSILLRAHCYITLMVTDGRDLYRFPSQLLHVCNVHLPETEDNT